MAAGDLPEDGELQLGSVRLPAGRRFTPDGHDVAVAWLTRDKVPDPGLIWSALTELHGETDLVPVVLNEDEDSDEDLFEEPCDAAEIDGLDPAELLAARWEPDLNDDEEQSWPSETPYSLGFLGLKGPGEGANSIIELVQEVLGVAPDSDDNAELEPLSGIARRRALDAFPGLAPPTGGSLSITTQTEALRSLRPARIGLIAARRPADVLAMVGWTCFDDPAYDDGIRNAVWIGAILRSWEDRFGAQLLAIGPGAQIRLVVHRPPPTLEAAQKIAEEHSAFCTECAGQGFRTAHQIAPALVDAPIWTFWWD